MLKYFDLNRRAQNGLKRTAIALNHPALQPIVRLSAASQICLYLGIFAGVLFSSAVEHYTTEAKVDFHLSFGICLISAVIALILIPLVYQKLHVAPESPYIVQLGFFVQQGVFWHVLMNDISKLTLSIYNS